MKNQDSSCSPHAPLKILRFQNLQLHVNKENLNVHSFEVLRFQLHKIKLM